MPNHAQITLIGHAGKDPEQRYNSGGDPVASVSMATTRKRKDQEVTSWWRIQAFGKTAEALARFITKGAAFGVTGEPVIEEWTDKDGNKRQTPTVYADRIILLGKAEEPRPNSASPSQRQQQAGGASGFDDMDGDIPF